MVNCFYVEKNLEGKILVRFPYRLEIQFWIYTKYPSGIAICVESIYILDWYIDGIDTDDGS